MIELSLNDLTGALNASRLGTSVKFIGCSTDTRNIRPGSLFIALRGERFDGHDFIAEAQQRGVVAAIVERPLTTDLPQLQVEDTRLALGHLATFWRQRFTLPVTAITGSNGKTTTKEMLRSIFQQQLNNQAQVLANEGNLNNDIGVPLTLFNLNASHNYAVIEMGANHPGEIAYLSKIVQPTVATITLCAPAHLEGFGSIEGVALAKGEIFSSLATNGIAVINSNDNYANLWRELAGAHQIYYFGFNGTADITAQTIRLQKEFSEFQLITPIGQIDIHLPLVGQHNVMNALAASACALAAGCSLTAIQQGLQAMHPVKGRLQFKQGIQGITLIDDTYNANPNSLYAALAVLQNSAPPRGLILGDMKELGEQTVWYHQQAGHRVKASGIEYLWAIGQMSRYAVESFGEGAYHFTRHQDLIEAVRSQSLTGATLLVKGSRSMQMEQVVNALLEGTENAAVD